MKSYNILVYTLEGYFSIQSSSQFLRMLNHIKSKPSLSLGDVGSKTRSLSQIFHNIVYTPADRVWSKSPLIFVRMLIFINLSLVQNWIMLDRKLSH